MHRVKFLTLLLILALHSPAQAQMSCMGLFNYTRPTEKQIDTAIYELQSLFREQYSKDPTVSSLARSQSRKKFSELKIYLTSAEIKERIKNITLNNDSNQQQTIRDQLKHSGNKVIDEGTLKIFINENFSDAEPDYFRLVHRAARLERGDILEILSKKNQEIINARDFNNNTALILSSHDNFNAVKILISNKAGVNISGESGFTALIRAAIFGKFNIADLLTQNGADIHTRDNNGRTALMWAAENGYMNITKLLIKHGADINTIDNKGQTALILAASNKRKDIAELLIKNGADVNIKDKNGNAAIRWPTIRDDHEFIELLKQAGATK